MTTVSVLFPSSFPQTATRIEGAREALRPFESSFNFHWPRTVRPRRPDDPKDYLAGSDAERCQEVMEFLKSKTSVGWFGRGGYGLTRILPLISAQLKNASIPPCKRWMGYSDITALFALCKALSVPIDCIHGPMVCAFPHQPNKQALVAALKGDPTPIPLATTSQDLEFHGAIWGGNLAVLASLAGTSWLPVPTSDSAVFLEDVGEAPYRVDRYFTQLHQSGFFARTNKVILGTFTEFEPATAVHELAVSRCTELGLDLLGQIPAGHSEPHVPLFLDKPYRYSPSERALIPNFQA